MVKPSDKFRTGPKTSPPHDAQDQKESSTESNNDYTGHPFTGGLLSSARQFDWTIIGCILVIKAVLFIFAVMSFDILENQPVQAHLGWLKIWNRWDSLSYQSLAQNGYQSAGEARFQLAFFPLFPWITRLFSYVFSDYLVSAIIVSGLASIIAGLLLQRLSLLDAPPNVARRAVWFLFIFPTSYFLHISYTESLFLALVMGCFLAARNDRWLLVGILGFLAGLTRINSLILIPALSLEAFQQYRETGRWRWGWSLILAIAIGFGGYLLLNDHVMGDPLAFMKFQQEHWYRSLTWPWVGIKGAWGSIWGRSPAESQMVGLQEFLFAALGLFCTIWCFRRLRPSYGVWMALNWLLFTSTSFMLSVPRYTLVMFPIFILFSRISARPVWNTLITTWSILFLALFTTLFVRGHWAF